MYVLSSFQFILLDEC